MTDSKPQTQLPATREAEVSSTDVPQVAGVVGATITGWQAKAATQAFRALSQAAQAKADAARSMLDLQRALGELGDVDAILEADQDARDFERWRQDRSQSRERKTADIDDEILMANRRRELASAMLGEVEAHRQLETAHAAKDAQVSEEAHKAYTASLVSEIHAVTAEQALNSRKNDSNATVEASSPSPSTSHLALLDDEIENARARGASQEVINALLALRARAAATNP